MTMSSEFYNIFPLENKIYYKFVVNVNLFRIYFYSMTFKFDLINIKFLFLKRTAKTVKIYVTDANSKIT